MADHRERVGARIREARNAKGWSQRELAERLPGAVDGPSVSRWETGKVFPEQYLDHLAEALDCDVAFFYAGSKPTGEPGDLMGALNGGDRLARMEDQLSTAIDAITGLADRVAELAAELDRNAKPQ